MSDLDELDIDGHLLKLLVAVVDAGSITGAAHTLGVTQSAVSHLLDKLRRIVGDPLFVKSGRGIRATARATALAPRARELMRELQRFAASGEFDPGQWRTTFTIAANDVQRELAAARARRAATRQGAGRFLAHHPLQRADGGHAAQRGLPAHRQPASASGRRHRAEEAFRRPLPGLL